MCARVHEEAGEFVVRPRVLRRPLRQRGAQGSHRVVGAVAPVGEGRAEEFELLAKRPDPDAEDQATVRHDIERPVALRDLERVVVANTSTCVASLIRSVTAAR